MLLFFATFFILLHKLFFFVKFYEYIKVIQVSPATTDLKHSIRLKLNNIDVFFQYAFPNN
jgi:hypothetical protein